MSSPESQKTFALESARVPTLKALYEDEEVQKQVPVALGKESLENARPAPSRPTLGHVARDGRALQRGPRRVRLLGTGLKNMQQELQNIVDQSYVPNRSPTLRLRRTNSLPAIQNVTSMCYAAAVAERGGPDRRTMSLGPGWGLRRFPDRRALSETTRITAEVEH
jgi:hypothetical protein